MTKQVEVHVNSAPDALPIATVERDSGISKDTLRVWERRYGFPSPLRDEFGARVYPPEQVDRLRAIKRLLDLGHRPGKVIALPPEALRALASVERPERKAPAQESQEFIALIKKHQTDELQRRLSRSLLNLGLARFVIDVVAPLNERVGDAWARGELEIYEEHLYTEAIQILLRNAIHAAPPAAASPRVLLTTFPQEPHGLGLLMAQAMLVLDGASCLSLGAQTPLWDIARAANARGADIVALSFSSSQNPNHVLDGLAHLRAALAPATTIWVGGGCPILYRRPVPGVTALRELAEIAPALDAWRRSHPSG